MYHPHPLVPMCCLPLMRCTVHRPCCMICNRGSKEKLGYRCFSRSHAYSNHIIIPVPRAPLLQGHYRTHRGAFVGIYPRTLIFWSKVSPVVQSSPVNGYTRLFHGKQSQKSKGGKGGIFGRYALTPRYGSHYHGNANPL